MAGSIGSRSRVMNKRFQCVAIVAAAVLALLPQPIRAQDLDVNGNETVIGSGGGTIASGSSFNDVDIGDSANGSLSVTNGGTISIVNLGIGRSGNSGELVVDGSGSEVEIRNNLMRIGLGGTGTVDVRNGGRIVGDTNIGLRVGGLTNGTLTVT